MKKQSQNSYDHVTDGEVVDNCFRCVVVMATADDVSDELDGAAETPRSRNHVERNRKRARLINVCHPELCSRELPLHVAVRLKT